NILLTYLSETPSTSNTPTDIQLRAKIGDFGSAKFIPPTQINSSKSVSTADSTHGGHNREIGREIGSPTYAAPERFSGFSSPASDIYSVGIILYEMLLGDRPFWGNPEALQKAHQTQPLPLPNTLTALTKQLLSTALHKDPHQRFRSAADMLFQLEQLPATFLTPPQSQPTTTPVVTFPQTLTPIPSNGITAPVELLLKTPQGCCIITAYSLHVLTRKRKLMSMARFSHPCWISVSPDGRWFSALPKATDSQKSQRCTEGMIGQLSHRSGHQWQRSIRLSSRLLTALQTDILQVIAIDSRHLVRIRSSQTSAKTIFEMFTRTGAFVGELFLNLSLVQVVPTHSPYQLIALSAKNQLTPATVLLITLKPFQVKQLRLPLEPEKVSALPWGYMVHGQRRALLLDRSAQPLSWLHNLPPVELLAAIDNNKVLMSTANPSAKAFASYQSQSLKKRSADLSEKEDRTSNSKTTERDAAENIPTESELIDSSLGIVSLEDNPSEKSSFSGGLSSLLVTDLKSLDIGLVF
ncbi:MAG: protein kinase, partial [Cyanobacteria bacterium J06649_4]